jgi:predicted nucleic acid-binding protein
MLTVYLDTCCLNRPFDRLTQDRMRLEAEAIVFIFGEVQRGRWGWLVSEQVVAEIVEDPDAERRDDVLGLLRYAEHAAPMGPAVRARAQALVALGISGSDALHVAIAESAQVAVLLTTDDRMLRTAERLGAAIRVRVANPLTWVGEVLR